MWNMKRKYKKAKEIIRKYRRNENNESVERKRNDNKENKYQ